MGQTLTSPPTSAPAQPHAQRQTSALPIDAALALFASILALLVILFSEAAAVSPLQPLCAVLLLHLVGLGILRRNIADPVIIFETVLLQYSYFPTIIPQNSDRFMRLFQLDGAYYIHSFAILAFLVAVFFAQVSIHTPPEKNIETNTTQKTALTRRIVTLGAIISIILSGLYAAQHGVVIGGSTNYADTFSDKMTTGSGFLLLSVPLAVAAMSCSVATNKRFFTYQNLYVSLPFIFLFIIHGQRKYIIIPSLIFAARYIRVVTFKGLIIIVSTFLFLYVFFLYLGFTRINNIDLQNYFTEVTINRFITSIPTIIGGESPAIFAAASAAFYGFVAPLPWFGDYLMSWAMAMPQFLFQGLFQPFNIRFAYALDPVTASLGYGWGFSFWGEAYAVGGWIMVALAAFGVAFSLQAILARSRLPGGSQYVWQIVLYSSLYYALWIQRNAFAYTLREFIVYQLAVILLLIGAAHLSLRFSFFRAAEPSPHPANPSPPRPLPR